MSLLNRIKSAVSLKVRAAEDWWFDRTRHVNTAAVPVPYRATDTTGPQRDGYVYGPARARNVRAALAALAIGDPSNYTFIDLGSGKGKVLFVAAELPFKRVIGVEYSAAMHRDAESNLRTLRPGTSTTRIELVHCDAATYDFPGGNLVLFMFNPFGPEITGLVMRNLQDAIRREPRHVVIIMLYPELAHIVAGTPGLRQAVRTRRFEIYEGGSRLPQIQEQKV